MESVPDQRAVIGVRGELHRSEPVRLARHHRARRVLRQIVNHRHESGRRVVDMHSQPVSALHEEVLVRVEVEASVVERIGRGSGTTRLRHKGEVHRLDASAVQTVLVVRDTRVLVLGQRVDVQRGAPALCCTTVPGWPLDPTRRVELQLQERPARRLADVARAGRVVAGVDVLVAIRNAPLRWIRRPWIVRVGCGLVVADVHPDPEGGTKLEVPRPAAAVLIRVGRAGREAGPDSQTLSFPAPGWSE